MELERRNCIVFKNGFVLEEVKIAPNLVVLVHVICFDNKFNIKETILHCTSSFFDISDLSSNEKNNLKLKVS